MRNVSTSINQYIPGAVRVLGILGTQNKSVHTYTPLHIGTVYTVLIYDPITLTLTLSYISVLTLTL